MWGGGLDAARDVVVRWIVGIARRIAGWWWCSQDWNEELKRTDGKDYGKNTISYTDNKKPPINGKACNHYTSFTAVRCQFPCFSQHFLKTSNCYYHTNIVSQTPLDFPQTRTGYPDKTCDANISWPYAIIFTLVVFALPRWCTISNPSCRQSRIWASDSLYDT